MARKKKTAIKSKVHGFEETSTAQFPDQYGLRLEQLCEEREVGMDGVFHWKDASFDDADIYNLMGWFELDGFHLDKGSPLPDFKVVRMLLPGGLDTFQYLSKIMKPDENHLSPGNIYHIMGTFRYEEPGEAHGFSGFNFVFNDITNIGFSARSIRF